VDHDRTHGAADRVRSRRRAADHGTGVGGIALALAVQNVLGDVLAALAIVFDKPFDVGDSIAVDNITGVVEHIGLKTTRIRSSQRRAGDHRQRRSAEEQAANLRRMHQRRAVFNLDVTFDTPPELWREFRRSSNRSSRRRARSNSTAHT
jgi:small-conductance mechanosensitive channel